MKIRLTLISILLVLSTKSFAQSLRLSPDSTTSYSMIFEFRKYNVSGLCVLRDDRQTVSGSCVNEFGIKIFDFKYDKRKSKVKLTDVFKAMDKWYIKRIVGSDLAILLRKGNTERQLRKHTLQISVDSVILTNQKYKLRYKFIPLYETER